MKHSTTSKKIKPLPLPLFAWAANRHHHSPALRLFTWRVDGNLNVDRIEVRHG